MSQDVRDAARTYAQGRPDLRLPEGGTWGQAETYASRYWATVRMPHLQAGVPVAGAELVISFNAERRVMQVSSSLKRFEGYTQFEVDAATAMRAAGLAVEGSVYQRDGTFYGGIKRQYVVRGTEARAAWLAWVPTLRPDQNWYVVVDAVTGEVLYKQNRVHTAFKANAYPASPGGLSGGVGVTPTAEVTLQHLDGGVLTGTQIMAWNCCTTEGCVDGGTPKHVTGTFNFGFPVPYDVAICDRLQRASGDASGDYLYTPVDPPSASCSTSGVCTAKAGDPAAEDLFAEAHAYHHVDAVYVWTRALSSSAAGAFTSDSLQPFVLRDAKAGKVPSVWANALMPNQDEATSSFFGCAGQAGCKATSNSMMYLDNAAFLPREQFSSSAAIPGISFDTDALVVWQGAKADFSYDATLLWHEFGHGLIYSTANLDFGSLSSDARSANNEGGALHEGLADYVAVAFGNSSLVGAYVGPRIDGVTAQSLAAGNYPVPGGALRDAANAYKCPDVLWGEPHQDGMHLTAALWEARSGPFAGSDNGATFDATVYAAIVSLAPNAGFAEFAAALVARVPTAFPAMADASTRMDAILMARGITQCSKVVDITGKAAPQRTVFHIADATGAGFASTVQIPGPVQFRLAVPAGADRVTVSFPATPNAFGQLQKPDVKLLVSESPVAFTRSATAFSSSAVAAIASPVLSGSVVRLEADVDVRCGGEVYVAFTGAGGAQLRDISVDVLPLASCACPSGYFGADGGVGASCVRWTDCVVSQTFETHPPSPTADRVCAPVTECGLAHRVVAAVATLTSDNICGGCAAGFFDSDSGAGVVCQPWTNCVEGQSFESSPPSATQDRTCAAVTDCGSTNRELSAAATLTSDTVCGGCKAGYFDSDGGVGVSCVRWADCVLGQTFESSPPSSTADRVCVPVADCGLAHRVVDAASTLTSNNVCGGCVGGFFDSDSSAGVLCVSWSKCSLGGTYEAYAPSPTADRVCAPVTDCGLAHRVVAAVATLTSDNICGGCAAGFFDSDSGAGVVCQPWTNCVEGQSFESSPPSATQDRTCAAVTDCGSTNRELSAAATLTSDTVCGGCKAGFVGGDSGQGMLCRPATAPGLPTEDIGRGGCGCTTADPASTFMVVVVIGILFDRRRARGRGNRRPHRCD